MKKLSGLALALSVACLPVLARAQPQPAMPPPAPPAARPVAFQFGMGYDFGGEKLLTVTFTDGSKETLRAEQGFSFFAGLGFARFPVGTVNLDTLVSIGVKGWNIGSEDDKLSYLVFPFEAMERLWAGQFRFGAGLSYLLSPRLSGKGMLDVYDLDLKNSLGFLLQAEWIGNRQPGRAGFSVGLRYAIHDLEAKQGGGSVGASTAGLNLGLEF